MTVFQLRSSKARLLWPTNLDQLSVVFYRDPPHDSISAAQLESKTALLEYLSDQVREAEDRMKRITDRVYKVGRRSDEAESRSGYPGRLGIGYGWL
jgi:hypothetical protein